MKEREKLTRSQSTRNHASNAVEGRSRLNVSIGRLVVLHGEGDRLGNVGAGVRVGAIAIVVVMRVRGMDAVLGDTAGQRGGNGRAIHR